MPTMRVVLLRQPDQGVREDLRVAGVPRLRGREGAGRHVELAHAVVLQGIALRRLVAVPLLGEGVHQNRAAPAREHLLHVLEGLEHHVHPVALDGPHVAEVQRLEEQARREEDLERLLGLARPVEHVAGHGAQELLRPALHGAHHGRRQLARQVGRERADVRVDGHLVVVQHHQEVLLLQVPGVVQRLEGHAGRHGAVADQRDHDAVLAPMQLAPGHAEGGRDRGARVAGTEVVVLGFGAPQELGDAVLLPDGVEGQSPAGQHLVRVALVADVEHEAISRASRTRSGWR